MNKYSKWGLIGLAMVVLLGALALFAKQLEDDHLQFLAAERGLVEYLGFVEYDENKGFAIGANYQDGFKRFKATLPAQALLFIVATQGEQVLLADNLPTEQVVAAKQAVLDHYKSHPPLDQDQDWYQVSLFKTKLNDEASYLAYQHLIFKKASTFGAHYIVVYAAPKQTTAL